jgi:hypothetical protein
LDLLVLLLVIGSSVWVGVDASNLGVRSGRLGGGSLLDMSIASWVVCCLLLWIIAFPCYLAARGRYRTLNVAESRQPGASALPANATGWHTPTSPPAPAQMSPDGRWWWDGQQWTPVVAPPPPIQG